MLDTALSPINAPRYFDPDRWMGGRGVIRHVWWNKSRMYEHPAP
jgi:hypothetical protein